MTDPTTTPTPTPPPGLPEHLASVCRDQDCPACGNPETYTELDIKTNPPTVLANGCRSCGWRIDASAALSLQDLIGLLYQLADNLAAVGPDAPDCPVDADWATRVLAYVPWLEAMAGDDTDGVLAKTTTWQFTDSQDAPHSFVTFGSVPVPVGTPVALVRGASPETPDQPAAGAGSDPPTDPDPTGESHR